jgi:hypothetical protein
MKKLLLFALILATSIIAYAEKRQIALSDFKWYSVEGNISTAEELISAIREKTSIDIQSFAFTSGKPVTIHTIIDMPEDSTTKLFFEVENISPNLNVLINGKPLTNLRQDGSFTSEITNSELKDELLLTLVIDNSATSSPKNFNEYLKEMYLSTISGICIAWCEPIKDPFFGGYMVEVHVLNLTPKDIDGKLKARVTDTNTFDLIAENNNCAFTRNNSEAIIDINFPDAKDKLVKGKYNIEIALVDKEKNEEVINRILTPIWLN